MPERQENPWTRLRLLGAGGVAVVAVGVVGYMQIEGWSFLDSLYMTLTTLTTVGFGEVHPLSSAGRLFTIGMLIMGVGLIGVLLALLAQAIQDGALGERGRRRRMQRRVAGLRDHFVICAYGRVGRTVAREFEAEGLDFVVVDRDPDLQEQLISDGVVYLIDDPTRESVLIEAGVPRAKGLISAVDDDADNLYIVLTARSINPDLYIVARASEEAAAEKLYTAGADRVISPYISSGRHMALLATRPQLVDYLEVESEKAGALRLEEMLIEPNSALIGKSLSELVPEGSCLVLRRSSGDTFTNPDSVTRMEEGDLLVLLAETDPSARKSESR